MSISLSAKILLSAVIATVLVAAWLRGQNPQLEVLFPEGFVPHRHAMLLHLDSAVEKQLPLLVSDVRRDAARWDELEIFVSNLAATSLAKDALIDGLHFSVRLPAGRFLLFSPDKRAAFIKLVDLKSDTILHLTRDDYVIGY